jgi:hypothetical protein
MTKCKFKAAQFYKVSKNEVEFQFNYFGEYETDKPEELEILHSLIGTYVQEVKHYEAPKEHVEDKAEVKEVKEPDVKEPEPKPVKKAEEKPKRSSKK